MLYQITYLSYYYIKIESFISQSFSKGNIIISMEKKEKEKKYRTDQNDRYNRILEIIKLSSKYIVCK
jgi:hypothetical protein